MFLGRDYGLALIIRGGSPSGARRSEQCSEPRPRHQHIKALSGRLFLFLRWACWSAASRSARPGMPCRAPEGALRGAPSGLPPRPNHSPPLRGGSLRCSPVGGRAPNSLRSDMAPSTPPPGSAPRLDQWGVQVCHPAKSDCVKNRRKNSTFSGPPLTSGAPMPIVCALFDAA